MNAEALRWAQAHNHCDTVACVDLASPHCECSKLAAGKVMLDQLPAIDLAVLTQHKPDYFNVLDYLVADLAIEFPELAITREQAKAARPRLRALNLLHFDTGGLEDSDKRWGSGYTLTTLGTNTLWAARERDCSGAAAVGRFIRTAMAVQP